MEESALTNGQKATIKEAYQQRPELSAYDIAKTFGFNKTLTLRFLQSQGYSTAKHKKAVKAYNEEKAKELAKEQGVKTIVLPSKLNHHTSSKAPVTIEQEKIKAMKRQAAQLYNNMMSAVEEGNTADFLRLRNEYAATKRRLEAYQKRGNYAAEDKSIYKLETQYHAI